MKRTKDKLFTQFHICCGCNKLYPEGGMQQVSVGGGWMCVNCQNDEEQEYERGRNGIINQDSH